MTVFEFCQKTGFEPLSVPQRAREINGAYAGDLLSWVMGNASEDNLWITIMTNSNVVAVASLVGVSAVVFAEGVRPEQEIIDLAFQKGINLISADCGVYECCLKAGEVL